MRKKIIATGVAAVLSTGVALADHHCGGCKACGAQAAQVKCGASNPCAAKGCNPCQASSCNACNGCNPCAASNCAPCGASNCAPCGAASS